MGVEGPSFTRAVDECRPLWMKPGPNSGLWPRTGRVSNREVYKGRYVRLTDCDRASIRGVFLFNLANCHMSASVMARQATNLGQNGRNDIAIANFCKVFVLLAQFLGVPRLERLDQRQREEKEARLLL